MSFIFANVKILGSIAFDAFPAFIGGLILGKGFGAVIGAFGHLLTALLSGFPYTLPVHIIVAVLMAITVYLFTLTYNLIAETSNKMIASVCASIIGAALNGPFSVFALQPFLLPMMGEAGLFSFSIILTTTSLANIILSFVVFFALLKSKFLDR